MVILVSCKTATATFDRSSARHADSNPPFLPLLMFQVQIEIVVPLASVRDAASVAATAASSPTCGGETGVGISQATDAPGGSMGHRTNRHPPPVLVDGSRNANEAFPSTEKRKRVLLKTCLLCYGREKLWHNNQRQVGAGRPPTRHQVVSGVAPSKSC